MKKIIKPENIRSMLKKEFRQLFRDVKMRAVMIGPPVMMVLVFGYAVNTDVKEARFALHDEDRTVMSREFVRKFEASPYFSLYADVNSPKDAVNMLDMGDIDFYLEIEKNFSRNIRRGNTSQVQVILDGSDSSRASVIMSYINNISAEYMQSHLRNRVKLEVMTRQAAGRRMPGLAVPEQRIFFNQDLKSINYFLPGILGLLISLITIMLTAMSIVKEREAGTIEQINVSPLHPFEYLMGKMIPFGIIGFVDMFIVTVIAITWFRVPFQGSLVFMLVCGLFYIVSTLSIGLYISTISMTQQQAMLSSFLFFIPALLLSGFIFPIYSMPESIQLVTYLNPLRYFINITRGVFLKGVGFSVLWPDILLMILIGITLLVMSVKSYSKRTV